jgi:hypothetical protein
MAHQGFIFIFIIFIINQNIIKSVKRPEIHKYTEEAT